jgi:hypothetical protein
VKVRSETISVDSLRTVLEILKLFNNNIPEPAKVNCNNPRDSIGPVMHNVLMTMSINQLMRLWSTARYLSMKNLRMHIACMFASMVYI